MGVDEPIRIGFVLHSMGVAGAEVLVAEILERGGAALAPTILCLDEVGELGRELGARGVEVVALGRRPGLDLRLAGSIFRACRQRDLELLHAHQYTPFFYSALARMRPGARFELILTEHGRHYPDAVSSRRRWINRWLLDRQAQAITGCSEFSRESLAAVDGFSRRRIELIPNGVDVERYATGERSALRRRLDLPPDRTLIVCVARLHPVKDHDTLVRAFARVAAERPETDLLLVGDGPRREALTRLASELAIDDRVSFLGVRHDVPELLQAADLFCMTSLSEAASLTVLEAMAAGLPIVVTAVGGNPELVEEGRNGLLAPRGDHEAVAGALLRLASSPEERARMGAEGRRRVESSYRLDQTVDAYLELFRRVARPAIQREAPTPPRRNR